MEENKIPEVIEYITRHSHLDSEVGKRDDDEDFSSVILHTRIRLLTFNNEFGKLHQEALTRFRRQLDHEAIGIPLKSLDESVSADKERLFAQKDKYYSLLRSLREEYYQVKDLNLFIESAKIMGISDAYKAIVNTTGINQDHDLTDMLFQFTNNDMFRGNKPHNFMFDHEPEQQSNRIDPDVDKDKVNIDSWEYKPQPRWEDPTKTMTD